MRCVNHERQGRQAGRRTATEVARAIPQEYPVPLRLPPWRKISFLPLTLNCPNCQTLQEIALQEQEDDQERNNAQKRGRGCDSVIDLKFAPQ